MKHKLFTIYDSKAEAYLPPFTLPTNAMAQRTFSDCANNMTHAFGQNPEDYTLFQIGDYDDSNAKIITNKTPLSLGLAIEYKKDDTPDFTAYSDPTDKVQPTNAKELDNA